MSQPLHEFRQALLAFHFKWRPDFDNYVTGPHRQIVKALKVLVDRTTPTGLYLAGSTGTGKTHLLLAIGQQLEKHSTGFYLDCSLLYADATEVLTFSTDTSWLLLDNLECIAGESAIEATLMQCLDQSRISSLPLVISGCDQPDQLGLKLPDLVSRLNQLPHYRLGPMSDDDYAKMLELRAQAAGLKLPPALTPYLLRYLPNNAGALMRAFDQIERIAMERGRALTVPLASEVLGRAQ